MPTVEQGELLRVDLALTLSHEATIGSLKKVYGDVAKRQWIVFEKRQLTCWESFKGVILLPINMTCQVRLVSLNWLFPCVQWKR